jgi:hypothetical protein
VEITLCVQKLHSCVCSSQYACEHHTKVWCLHAKCGFDTYKCQNHFCECHNHTHRFQYHTLRVEITLVRFEITVVSVVTTFLRVKITLHLVITLRVEITRCVRKSHFAFRNFTRTCVHYSMRVNITHKSDFYTQSMVLSVMITFVLNHTHTCQHRSLRV